MSTNVRCASRGATSTTRAPIATAPGTDRRLVGGGARRADWLDKTSELLLPKVNYFQVVFTLPDRLVRTEKLRLQGECSKLKDPSRLQAWLDELTATGWNVFIEGPPHGKSKPTQVLKYLARYMTGVLVAKSPWCASISNLVQVGSRSSNETSTPIPRSTLPCTTSTFELPPSTRSTNMDSTDQRHGERNSGWSCDCDCRRN